MKTNQAELDQVDISILKLLQDNARLANVHLATKLQMAPSAVLERVRKLEEKAVIKGYSTNIDAALLDKKLLAFIFIKTADAVGSDSGARAFAALPEVLEVHHIAGEDCYLLKVRVSDTDELMRLKRSKFSKIPQILSMRTTIVMETVKETQKFLIDSK